MAGNRVLYDQFKTQLKSYLQRLSLGLNEAVETYERTRLVRVSIDSIMSVTLLFLHQIPQILLHQCWVWFR